MSSSTENVVDAEVVEDPPTQIISPKREYETALRSELDAAKEYQKAAYAEQTRKVYQQTWRDYLLYCAKRGLVALPAEPATVCAYLAYLAKVKPDRKGKAGQKFATIDKALTVISVAHKAKGVLSPRDYPAVRSTIRGIANTLGRKQDPVDALRLDDLKKAVAPLPDTLQGLRDRALLVLCYGGAFRRSELSALTVGDLDWRADKKRGVVVILRKSKTDQEGRGTQKPIRFGLSGDEKLCPVKTLQTWLKACGALSADDKALPVFRAITKDGRLTRYKLSGDTIYRIVRKYTKLAGIEGRFGAHSLRAGFVTDAAAGRAQVQEIMKKTGHRRADTVMRYIREAELFDNDAAEKTGL